MEGANTLLEWQLSAHHWWLVLGIEESVKGGGDSTSQFGLVCQDLYYPLGGIYGTPSCQIQIFMALLYRAHRIQNKEMKSGD